jgi:hypothetical protein
VANSRYKGRLNDSEYWNPTSFEVVLDAVVDKKEAIVLPLKAYQMSYITNMEIV